GADGTGTRCDDSRRSSGTSHRPAYSTDMRFATGDLKLESVSKRCVAQAFRPADAGLKPCATVLKHRSGPMRAWVTALLSIVASACASAPVAPPAPAAAVGPTFEQKISWILRLEDQRVLRDPASAIAPAPPPAPVRGRQPVVVAQAPPAPPAPPD